MMPNRATRRRKKRLSSCATRRPRFEPLEKRLLLAGVPYGAHPQDTGEYMLGDVVATVVFFESDGSLDPSTEDWNELVRDANGNVVFDQFGDTISVSGPNLIEQTKDRIVEGLQWWEDTLVEFYARMYDNVAPIHSLNFIYDFEYAHNPIATGYEPIARTSNYHTEWVDDFLDEVGFNTINSIHTDVRSFNDSQRIKYGADWAFTIFIANDYNDDNGRFAPGGEFSLAFAYAGGRYLVAPSGRPASTFAHETGHIFWAKDEYLGSSASYSDYRGYYNTQNWNAHDNPAPGFVQQTSIMNGDPAAWTTHVSSDSSLAMIGWQDSDGDGVFDVLDVPLTLTGSGYYDAAQGAYHFLGHSSVQTLPNANTSGRQNDITINEVSQAVYSFDGGSSWLLAEAYSAYDTDLDLTIPAASGQEILIRTQTVDPGTGKIVVTSQATLVGSTSLPTIVDNGGIHGFAWHDQNGDGNWDVDERGLSGWQMQLVDPLGQPVATSQVLEPDDYQQWQLVNDALVGVTLSAQGFYVKDSRVGAVTASSASTGEMVFGYVMPGTSDVWGTDWTTSSRVLRIDFADPTTFVSIDAVAPTWDGAGRLEIYDADDNLLARYTTGLLRNNESETMTLTRSTPDIAYAIARSTMEANIRLDNLRVGPRSTAVTDTYGAYTIPNLEPGTYRVQATPPTGWAVTDPLSGVQEVVVQADGTMQWDENTDRPSDFGGQFDSAAFPWRNPRNPLDVDDNYLIIPLDALYIINRLNSEGAGPLPTPSGNNAPPPYYDTSGDNWITPLDALLVINYLNDGGTGGLSGLSGGSGGSGQGSASGSGEGEWSVPASLASLTHVGVDQSNSRTIHGPTISDASELRVVDSRVSRDALGIPAGEAHDRVAEFLSLSSPTALDWDDLLSGVIVETVRNGLEHVVALIAEDLCQAGVT